MRNLIKILLTLFSIVLLAAIAIPALLAALLSNGAIQNFVADRIARAVSVRAGTTVSVDRVDVRLFNRLAITGVYVEDLNGDTLLYVGNLTAAVHGYGFANRTLNLGEVNVDGTEFRITQDSTGKTNLSQIVEKFKRERKRKSRGFNLRAAELKVSNSSFDFKEFALDDINISLRRISAGGGNAGAVIENISFRENRGFTCKGFSAGKVSLSSGGVNFEGLQVTDGYSEIKAPVLVFGFDNNISLNLDDALLDVRTLAFLNPSLRGKQLALNATGTVEGTVSDISFDFTEIASGGSRMALSGRVAGIPDMDNARFTVNVPSLATSLIDIRAFYEGVGAAMPENFEKYLPGLGNIYFNGMFDGMPSDFTASGTLSSAQGSMDFDMAVKPSGGDVMALDGEVSVDGFDAGSLLATENLGDFSFTGNVAGVMGRDTLAMHADGVVSHLRYKGYDYRDIIVNGEVGDRYYKGFAGSDDPNIDFEFNGMFDFSGRRPRYDFDLYLAGADLKALGFNSRDSVAVISGHFAANASGATLRDINGEGRITDLLYRFNADTLSSGEIVLLADNLSDNRRAGFYSDFADVEIRSRLNFYDLWPYLRATLHKYLPSIEVDSTQLGELRSRLAPQANSPDNYYIITGNVKQTNKLAGAITSGINITEGTRLSFMFNPAEDNFSLQLNSGYIQFRKFHFTELDITALTQSDSVSLYLSASEVEAAGGYMQDFSLIGRVENNRVDLGAGFGNGTDGVTALINTSSLFTSDPLSNLPRIETRFTSSSINLDGLTWRISSPGITFIPSQKVVEMENLRIYRSDQGLTVNGRVSADISDTLHMELDNFDMKLLSGLVRRQGYELGGRMNGYAQLMGFSNERRFFSAINLNDVTVNNLPVRNSVFTARWDDAGGRIAVALGAGEDVPVIFGGYHPGEKRYSFNVNIQDINLALLQPLIGNSLRDVGGSADSEITVESIDGKPSLNGAFRIKEFHGTVDYTNVRYNLAPNTVMTVDNSNFSIRGAKLYDGLGGEADVEGFFLRSTYLRDFSLNLNVTPRNILALNTTYNDNDLFYGRAFASGTVSVTSGRKMVDIDITARTENNSAFYMPIANSVSTVDDDFITYRRAAADSTATGRQQSLNRFRERRNISDIRSDMDIRLEIDVLPNTEVRLDPAEGSILRGNGTGRLSLHIKPREELFTIMGDYRINEGSYEFMSSYIPADKRFSIERGSYIRWTGNPLDAYIDVTATYRIRTSIAPLVGNDSRFTQNVPVNCKVILNDMLRQPTISFDVEVPTADAEIQSIVRNAMSTQEMKSTQFLYLLATNRFYAENMAGASSNIGTAATVSTGIEFLTNQISNMISSDRYKFNLGYRPRSDMSSDEIDFSFEQELIPDRLIIEGEANYNLRNNPNSMAFRNNHLAGDFYITYIIDRMGNLRASAFTRTVDRFDENQGLQEHGLGLYYSRDFNLIRELFRRRRSTAMPLPAVSPEEPE